MDIDRKNIINIKKEIRKGNVPILKQIEKPKIEEKEKKKKKVEQVIMSQQQDRYEDINIEEYNIEEPILDEEDKKLKDKIKRDVERNKE